MIRSYLAARPLKPFSQSIMADAILASVERFAGRTLKNYLIEA